MIGLDGSMDQCPPRQVGGPSYKHERVSSVGDLGGGYIKESLKWDEKGAYGCRVVAALCLVSSARR
jgi:hypothetical protein